MANSHPGSYCGQDAYNDMFVTEKRNESDNTRNFSLNNSGRISTSVKGKGLQGSSNSNTGGGTTWTIVMSLL